MKKLSFFCLISLVLFCLNSCGSYEELLYFKNLDSSSPTKEKIENFTAITIQKDDLLGINVGSLNPEASALFNVNFTNSGTPNNPSGGYQVDQKGMIEIPLIGNLKAEGLNTSALRDEIKSKLQPYLKEAVVNVRILNFKVSVLGDVGRPGIFPVQSERITLTEAIVLAGDLNVTANRNELWLIRERDGKREYIPISLTSKEIFRSPYYYLKNNDLLYVPPGKGKTTSEVTYRNLGLLLSFLSLVAIIVTNN